MASSSSSDTTTHHVEAAASNGTVSGGGEDEVFVPSGYGSMWGALFIGVEAIIKPCSCGYYDRLSAHNKLTAVISVLDLLWLSSGVLCYCVMHDGIHGDFTFAKALYLAVNLGIGVGYSNVYPEHQAAIWFTVAYAFVGLSLVAGSILIIVHSLINAMNITDKDTTVEDESRRERQAAQSENSGDPLLATDGGSSGGAEQKEATWWHYLTSDMWTFDTFAVLLWAVVLVAGMLWYKFTQESSYLVGMFYAATTLTTSGLSEVKEDDLSLWLCTIYVLIAVPLNIFVWTTVMNHVFVLFVTEKVKETVSTSDGPRERRLSNAEDYDKDWAGFLEAEAVRNGYIPAVTLQALRARYDTANAQARGTTGTYT